MIQIYADGSSTGKVGEGGWGFVALDQDEKVIHSGSGGDTITTNNRMELLGVIEGLIWAQKAYSNQPVKVFSDSQYVVKGITEWYPKWEIKMQKGKQIKNQDLWIMLKSLVDLFTDLEFQWVRGHSNIEYNEICDKLAKAAKQEQKEKICID